MFKPILKRVSGVRLELLIGLSLKGGSAAASFMFNWLLAHVYGASMVGMMQIALVTVSLSSLAMGMGLDRIIVRTMVIAITKDRKGEARAAFETAIRRQLLTTGAITLVLLVFADQIAVTLFGQPALAPFLRIIGPCIVTISCIRLCASALRSSGRVLLSQLLDGVSYTSISAAVLATAWLAGWKPATLLPPWTYLLATVLIFVIACIITFSMIRSWEKGTVALPIKAGLFIALTMSITQSGELLGLMMISHGGGAEASGVFRIAYQVCMLFILVDLSFSVMLGPHIAAAGARSDAPAVRKLIHQASGLGVLLCLPLLLACLFGAEFILGMFGPEFVGGATALRIMATGQIINVAFGPLGASLEMMHRERTVMRNEVVATLSNVSISFLLLPAWGISGVAIGYMSATLVRNSLALVAFRKLLRLMESSGSVPARGEMTP